MLEAVLANIKTRQYSLLQRSPFCYYDLMTLDTLLRSQQHLKVVNLLGAPGMGKSAIASGLFYLMKKNHHSAALCREYAQYLVTAGREWQLREEQLYLFAKQHHELFIQRGNYRTAVTDSPLLLTAFYAAPDLTPPSFYQCVRDYNEKFENIYFFISRDIGLPHSVFDNSGRVHNREESLGKEKQQRSFLEKWNVQYTDIKVKSAGVQDEAIHTDEDPAQQIYDILLQKNWFSKDGT